MSFCNELVEVSQVLERLLLVLLVVHVLALGGDEGLEVVFFLFSLRHFFVQVVYCLVDIVHD